MVPFGITANSLSATAHDLLHEILIDRYIGTPGEAPSVLGGGPVPRELDITTTARSGVTRRPQSRSHRCLISGFVSRTVEHGYFPNENAERHLTTVTTA